MGAARACPEMSGRARASWQNSLTTVPWCLIPQLVCQRLVIVSGISAATRTQGTMTKGDKNVCNGLLLHFLNPYPSSSLFCFPSLTSSHLVGVFWCPKFFLVVCCLLKRLLKINLLLSTIITTLKFQTLKILIQFK